MSSVLCFKNTFYYKDSRPATIAGKNFQALMDLCFAHADTFSLHRCDWAGAHDGALEQALRPYRLGEYASYARLSWFDKEYRELCYLYPATQETKEILLKHIHHLFDVEKSLAPVGHETYLRQKYAAYHRAEEEADDHWTNYLDHGGWDCSEEQREAAWEAFYRKAKQLWLEVFREEDYYSHMDDPCFFRGTELFFETVTHEQECFVHVLSPEFEKCLYKLGKWVDRSAESHLPLFSLDTADGLKRYERADLACEMKPNVAKTQAYYSALRPENICGCSYCKNYCARVKATYPEIAQYLFRLGVDIEKPFETSPLEPDENGYLEYCVCQYIVFGTCPKEYHHQVGEVIFGVTDCHPSTGIEEAHFVLDLYPIRLKFEESDEGGE